MVIDEQADMSKGLSAGNAFESSRQLRRSYCSQLMYIPSTAKARDSDTPTSRLKRSLEDEDYRTTLLVLLQVFRYGIIISS